MPFGSFVRRYRLYVPQYEPTIPTDGTCTEIIHVGALLVYEQIHNIDYDYVGLICLIIVIIHVYRYIEQFRFHFFSLSLSTKLHTTHSLTIRGLRSVYPPTHFFKNGGAEAYGLRKNATQSARLPRPRLPPSHAQRT